MNQCLSSRSDIALKRGVGCSFASNDRKLLLSLDDFMTCNDNCVASRTDSTVLFENKNITMNLENETTSTARLSQNTLPSRSACSTDHRSSSEKNDRPEYNCNCIINHRNQNHIRKKRARRYLHLGISSIMKSYFSKMFRLAATHRDHLWRIGFFLVFNYMFLFVNAVNECAIGIETPGWTEPRGDIIIKYGDPLRIKCVLNETYIAEHSGINSSNLIFIRNQKKMEPEYMSVYDRKSLLLYEELPPASDNMYYCQLNLTDRNVAVCLNKVVIGYDPQAPSNFTCRSYNWENLTCTWNPQLNYVQTKHELSIFIGLDKVKKMQRLSPCPQKENNYCYWTLDSTPMYRQSFPNITFLMKVSNQFGNLVVTYKINHYALVIPAKSEGLLVINKTSNSAILQWDLPYPIQSFPPGLIHKIMYQNQWDLKKDWKVIIIDKDIRLPRRVFNLTGLKYANTVYDCRVYSRSAKAVGEDMYSEPSVITFRTLPKLPSFSPQTDIGSFEIIENNGNRDIYLYWQMIPQYYENGDNFKYHVNHVEENGHEITLEPVETTKTYAKFKGLSFNNYRFKIVSMNKVGVNKNYTEIIVPSRDKMPSEPIAFTKMAFEGGLYELSWKPPIMHQRITNYTIFWCENERDRPYQCIGYLNWTHVSANTTVYNLTVPEKDKVYQFAISANSNKGSSGMIWSSCTVIHTKVLSKMKSVWINRIGSDFIEVGWKLDCSDRIGIVEGFRIYYCPIVSPLDTKCKGPKHNITIKSYPPMISGTLKHLTPYTTYMLEITTVTKNGESQLSDPLYNTTLEAAPSTSPLNVTISSVTNTTMFITWRLPKAMNGVLRYYEVYYNNFMKKVEEENHIKLTDLLAYTEYNISIAACTVACSKKSPIIKERTEIGIPGKIGIPTVRFINSSQVILTWDAAHYPAGPINRTRYEIETSYGEIHNVSKMGAQLAIPDCKTVGQERQYKFRVRAINISPNNESLTGPWSEVGEGNCYSDGPSQGVLIIIWVIGVIIVIALILGCVYGTKRVVSKCHDMQDFEVKLPPGLAPNTMLLDGEPHIRQPSADSSGCSSGQESVTSSLTTTEFQISSDSGTEVDPMPVSPGTILENLSNWESNSVSLRQRSVSRGPETTSHCWDVTYVTGGSNLNEIISQAQSTPNLTESTGNTTTPQTWPSTGYNSMLSCEDLSSNPSPTSRGNTVVNVACCSVLSGHRLPATIQTTFEEDGEDGMDSEKAGQCETLIPSKVEVSLANNMYVPFTTVVGIQKEVPTVNYNLDELSTFVESDKSEEDALMSHLNTSDTMTTSKSCFPLTLPNPIEQSGKSDICNFLTSTSLADSCNEPVVSSFVSLPVSSTSLIDTIATDTTSNSTNPHHIVTHIGSNQKSAVSKVLTHPKEKNKEILKLQKTSHIPHNSMPNENFSKPSVPASSVHEVLQQQQQENIELSPFSIMENIEEMESKEKDSTSYLPVSWVSKKTDGKSTQPIIIKQSSGYVTIADNSDPKIQKKPITNQSDEKYSRVTIVPSIVQ